MLAVLALAPGTAFARLAEIKSGLAPFSEISVSNDFELYVEKADSFAVEIVVDEMLKDYVQAAVSEGVLSIYLEEKKITADVKKYYRSRNAPTPVFRATAYVPSSIGRISMSGASVLVRLGEVLDTARVSIALSDEASARDVSVRSREVRLAMGKRSEARLDVECGNLEFVADGPVDAAISHKTTSTSLDLSSSASLVLNGQTERLSVAAKGTCRAILNGSAEFTGYNLSGSASVNAVNLQCGEANVEMSSISTLTQSATEKLFLTLRGGAKLTYKNSPDIYINGIRNSSVLRYNEEEPAKKATDDSTRRTL